MYENIKQAFFEYVELDFPVIPLCPHKHQRMSATHREKCKYPGKVPLIRNWSQHQSTSYEQAVEWLEGNPFINIGLPMGQNSGMIGIDIDGTYGEQMLQQYSQGNIPETWEFLTNGGRRLLYRIPAGIKTKKMTDFNEKEEHSEFAILCDGQQTVLPPSIHYTGFIYEWVAGRSPWEEDLANAPEWLLALCTAQYDDTKEIPPPTLEQKDWQEQLTEGSRNTHLTKLAGSLLSRRNIPKEEVVRFLDAWNQEHCSPPLSLVELQKMVDTLATSEAKKAAKRKAKVDKKKSFRPTVSAARFITAQEAKGYHWQFAIEQGAFYFCDSLKGPWQRVDNVLVQKSIRAFLVDPAQGGDDQWDTMHYVNETLNALRERLAGTKAGLFDIGQNVSAHEGIVSVLNGLLDWRTLELAPWTPDLNTTIQMNVEWNAEATAPIWNRVLTEWIPDGGARRFLQEYIGLCLIPDTSFRTAVFLYGAGANGKSLFLEVIKNLFGALSLTSIPLHRLADRFEVASLQNKLLNICGDIDSKYLADTGLLKALIGGDSLRGEIKHGKSFDFVPVARLIFSANTLPKVGDKSIAWYSRWKFIHFPNQFPVNSAYKLSLMKQLEKEQSGILRWAIEGLRRLKQSNSFTTSSGMLASEQSYRLDNDNVLAFTGECLREVQHTGAETTLLVSPLYAVYREWCEYGGMRAVGQIEFCQRLHFGGVEKVQRKVDNRVQVCFLGVAIAEEYKGAYDFFKGVRRK